MPKWILILLGISTTFSIGIVMAAGYKELGDYFTEGPLSAKGQEMVIVLIGLVAMHLVLIATFILPPLKLRIDRTGITYSCFPYQVKEKHLNWNDIESLHFAEISALGDFGGWGYRRTWKGKRGYIFGDGPALFIQHQGKEWVFTIDDIKTAKMAVNRFGPENLKETGDG